MASGYDAKKKAAEVAKKKATKIAQAAAAKKRAATEARTKAVTASGATRSGARPSAAKRVSGFGQGPMGSLPSNPTATAATTATTAATPAAARTPKATDNGRVNVKKTTSTSNTSSRSSSTPKATASKPAGKPVSQSRTEWVAKGTMVNGKAVEKGYLAQKGKPEKRVTANVKIVTDTASGKKTGQTYSYKSGRTMKKGK